jgi:hypothetical protein
MLMLQTIEIHWSFQKSIISSEKGFEGKVLWSHVQENVSRKALKHLAEVVAQVEEVGTDKLKCDCLNRIIFQCSYA